MPGAKVYEPNDRELRDRAEQERSAILKKLKVNKAYYLGQQYQWLEDPLDNVTINLCRQVVDRIVSFLAPEFPQLEISGGDLVRTEDEQWLADVWEANNDDVLLGNMAINGCLNGQVYARVFEGDIPRVVNLNPANVLAFWNEEDFNQILWYAIYWEAGQVKYRQDIVEDGQRWLIIDYKKDANSNTWMKADEVVWPYPLCPVVDWQHLSMPNVFYGNDEFQHRWLNDLINKVASDISRILRFHAYPRTIGTGFTENDVKSSGIDDFWTIENEDARVYNLEMQSDLAASIRQFELLNTMFLRESRVVIGSGDFTSFRGVTNLGIRMTYLDMIAKNESLRRNYGRAIQQLSMIMQMVAKKAVVAPSVIWPDPLPTDEREVIGILQQQINMGMMSLATASKRAGLDFDQEQNAIQQERLELLGGFDGTDIEDRG